MGLESLILSINNKQVFFASSVRRRPRSGGKRTRVGGSWLRGVQRLLGQVGVLVTQDGQHNLYILALRHSYLDRLEGNGQKEAESVFLLIPQLAPASYKNPARTKAPIPKNFP